MNIHSKTFKIPLSDSYNASIYTHKNLPYPESINITREHFDKAFEKVKGKIGTDVIDVYLGFPDSVGNTEVHSKVVSIEDDGIIIEPVSQESAKLLMNLRHEIDNGELKLISNMDVTLNCIHLLPPVIPVDITITSFSLV